MLFCVFLQSIKEFQPEEHLQILEEEAALGIKEDDKSLYVCEPFRGVVFSHLRKVCYPSTTSSCVLSFLQASLATPALCMCSVTYLQ